MSDARADRAYAEERFAADLREVLDELERTLLAKNRKYGDAALNPIRVFSRAEAAQEPDEDEDVKADLLGYMVLERIAQLRAGRASGPGEPAKPVAEERGVEAVGHERVG